MNYAAGLARISVQPQNYSDENWDDAMALCDKADAEITTLNAEVKYTRDIMLRYRNKATKYEKLRAGYNDQIRIIEELEEKIEELETAIMCMENGTP
jgi:archaellum component FlaC